MIVRCSKCGGTNVQVVMWVRPNHNNEAVDDFGSWKDVDSKFCEDCDDHVALKLDEGTLIKRSVEIEWKETVRFRATVQTEVPIDATSEQVHEMLADGEYFIDRVPNPANCCIGVEKRKLTSCRLINESAPNKPSE